MFVWLRSLVSRLNVGSRVPQSEGSPYQLTCLCGSERRGRRTGQRQILVCSGCGKKLCVFPDSPWPLLEEPRLPVAVVPELPPAEALPRAIKSRSSWWQPVVAGLATLGIVVGLLLVTLFPHTPPIAELPLDGVRALAGAAQQALAKGDLSGAYEHLAGASRSLSQLPHRSIPPELQGIAHLHKQVAIACDLLPQPLEELILEAQAVPTEAWRARFAAELLGKAMVFDAHILTDPQSVAGFKLDYEPAVGPHLVRIDLADCHDWRTYPTHPPIQRLTVGVRLRSIRLEETPMDRNGVWVVRFQADSLIPITDQTLCRVLEIPPENSMLAVLDQKSTQLTNPLPQPRLSGNAQRLVDDGLAAAIREALGQPQRIAREVFAEGYYEQWIYDDARIPRVHLEQRRGDGVRLRQAHPQLRNLPKLQKK